jgi:hypothetical protein
VTNSSIPDSDAFNWVIAPASQCVRLLADTVKVNTLLRNGTVALTGQPNLLKLARQHLLTHKKDVRSIDAMLANHGGTDKLAAELMQGDFDLINRIGLIGLWVPVEVAVEDTFVLTLTKVPELLVDMRASGVKVPAEATLSITEEDAKRVFRRMEARARKDNAVIEAYVSILQSVQITIDVPAGAATTLSELNYVRNCLLHRAGFVDERALVEAPNLGVSSGRPVPVPGSRYREYMEAAHTFALALMQGVLASPYVRTRPVR